MQPMVMEVHPIEYRFLQQIRRWRFGTLREVKIEDGLPISAEFLHERTRFNVRGESDDEGSRSGFAYRESGPVGVQHCLEADDRRAPA